MPLFCRHNRFVQNCPICSKEEAAKRQAAAPGAGPRRPASGSGGAARSRPRSGGLVVRRAARAADDGYSSSLVPGIRGSADADRLAGLVAREDELLTALALEPPPPWDSVATAGSIGDAAELAVRIVLRATDGEPAGPEARALAAYHAWTQRHGGAEAAFVGDPNWSPQRRFDRIFERLAFPAFGRERRFRLLTVLGATGRVELEAASLHFGSTGDDPATLAAKRVLNSGDTLLLDRRAKALAEAFDVPLAALDGAFAAFEAGERLDGEDADGAHRRLRAALGLH